MDWKLPGPASFLDRCLEAREHWKAAVLVTPVFLVEDFGWSDLKWRLRDRGFGELEVIKVEDCERGPASSVANALGVDRVYSAEDLVASGNLPCSNIGITGLHGASRDLGGAWCDFLKDFSRAVHRQADSSVWILVLMPPTAEYPTSDTYMDVIPWWGRMTESDVSIATRERMEKFPPVSTAMRLWLESLCVGLGPTRLELIDRIIECTPIAKVDIKAMITEVLDGVGVNGRSPYARMPLELAALTPPHPDRRSEAATRWERGLLDWSDVWGIEEIRFDDDGKEVDSDWLDSRVCRGQKIVIGRAIDRIRLAVDLWIEHRYGGRWDEGLTYGDSKFETERREGILGLYRLAEVLDAGRSDFPRPVLRLLRSWKHIRNDLAHNQAVEYRALEYAVIEYESFLGTYQSGALP